MQHHHDRATVPLRQFTPQLKCVCRLSDKLQQTLLLQVNVKNPIDKTHYILSIAANSLSNQTGDAREVWLTQRWISNRPGQVDAGLSEMTR
uniref:Uncharacterized protein n=1 Tax=Erwinia amylovora ATCC BAA-2158 TaxID=889211 RepID=E5B1F2_ERWAM|nr:hypothetical protein EAIL5_0483 [Erwinia amylovora ATCC BAA-2158]